MTLASFPGIAAVVSLARVIADPERIRALMNALSNILPNHVIRILEAQIRLALQESPLAGDESLISSILLFAVMIWSANRGTRVLIDALNIVYGRTETRSFLLYTGVTLAMTAGVAIVAVLAIAGILMAPPLLARLGIEREITQLLTVVRWPVLFAVGAAAIQVLYRLGPSHERVDWRWIGAGSLTASVLWVAFSAVLSWYLGVFGSVTELYGSLRTVVGFMLWLWLSVLAVLIGAEVDAVRREAPATP